VCDWYLGSTVNTDNKIEEEIKERISLGNKAFFANKKLFQSKLISKNVKLKLYVGWSFNSGTDFFFPGNYNT